MSQSPVSASEAELAMALGARIRQIRGMRGLTLRELATHLGVSPATVSAVEHGRTGISAIRLTEIARLLEVSAAELLAPTSGGDTAVATPGPQTLSDWRRYDPLSLDAPLMAALEAFLEVGYHGSTVRDIARRAELSVPGIYHHYSSKQEMLLKILDLTMIDLIHRCELVLAEAQSTFDRFCLLIENLALFHTHRRELGFIGASEMRSLEEPGRERIVEMRKQIQDYVDDEVVRGHEAGLFAVDAPREAARAVVTMCTGLAQWYSTSGPASAEQIARWYVGFALDVVRYQG
ncbi:TetR family transcriptional regulator [Mycobacterium sp. NPDC003449]